MNLAKAVLLVSVACISNGFTINDNSTTNSSAPDVVPQLKEKVQIEDNVTKLQSRQTKIEGDPSQLLPVAYDCKELYNRGYFYDGVYIIFVGVRLVPVWCDMTNGGWILLQKRYDGSQDFAKTFNEYTDGFGNLNGEFWLGLQNVHELTTVGNWSIRVHLESFYNESAWVEYSDFRIGAGTGYTLNFATTSYQGTAGESLDNQKGMKFSTFDKDQDMSSNSCSRVFLGNGGWWSNACEKAVTTGCPYGIDDPNIIEKESEKIKWNSWKGAEEGLKSAVIKFRRND